MVQGNTHYLSRVVKLSLQWPEIRGHAEARDHMPGGDECADKCQLYSSGTTLEWIRGIDGGRSRYCGREKSDQR